MGLQGTPLVLQPHLQHVRSHGGGVKVSMNVPAQVCKFLIDSLQRHREGVLCCAGGLEGVVESWGSRGRSKRNEVLQTLLLAIKTGEGGYAEG